MMGHATYESEELTVEFSAALSKCDYGVRGSPVWLEPSDIKVDKVEILGIEVPYRSLPTTLRLEIYHLHEKVEFQQ